MCKKVALFIAAMVATASTALAATSDNPPHDPAQVPNPAVGLFCAHQDMMAPPGVNHKTSVVAWLILLKGDKPQKGFGIGVRRYAHDDGRIGYPTPYMAHAGCWTIWDLRAVHAVPGLQMPRFCLLLRFASLHALPADNPAAACGTVKYDRKTGWWEVIYQVTDQPDL